MQLELKQNLIHEGTTLMAGTRITVGDMLGENLVARGIAIDAGLAEDVRKIREEADAKIAEAQAKAAEAEGARVLAAQRIDAEAKAKAEEARAKGDRRSGKVHVDKPAA